MRVRRLIPRPAKDLIAQRLVDEFHSYYYRHGPLKRTSWLGVPTQQLPGDMIVFQQIVWDTRPDLIVETGTAKGAALSLRLSLRPDWAG